MFVRQSVLTRYVIAMFAGALCVFIWNHITGVSPSHRVVPIQLRKLINEHFEVQHEVRELTPQNNSGNVIGHIATNEHMVGNESLKEAMKNMTLLHVNNTHLQEIITEMKKHPLPIHRGKTFELNSKDIVNPHDFKYILNTPNLCKDKDVFMLAYIHTGVGNYKRRMVIRQTWGNVKNYNVIVRVVFVMGISQDKPELQQALQFESEQYGDVVQEDFVDSYHNLTYKGIAALKWITNHCSHARYVLKSDDDIFVNTFTLIRHLQSLTEFGIEDHNLLMCLVWHHMPVLRTGKWKVSEEDFKEKFYPTYCSGSAFTMSTDAAMAMHNVSYTVPFFWVDDFYITGLLPLKLNITHKQFMSTYVLDGRKLEEKFTGTQWYTYVFSHVHDLKLIQNVWNKMVTLEQGSNQPEIAWAAPGKLPNEKEYKAKVEAARQAKQAEKKKKKEEEKKKKEAAMTKKKAMMK